jgi:uncharacterized protein YbaA (DUF1428 family)
MYVDGFLVPVPTARKEAYRAFAAEVAPVFKAHGALSVVEAWGDDVPPAKLNSMGTAVLLEPDETVVFAWIAWPDKAARDEGMKKVAADPRNKMGEVPPFDAKRMIFGGFETIVGP